MFFNPLFLQVINNQETLAQSKPQKLNGSSYLFSDIIKVQLDKTDIPMPENDLEAGQSVLSISQSNTFPGTFSPLVPQAGRSKGLLDSIVGLLPSVIKQKDLSGNFTPQTISNFIGSFKSAVSANTGSDLNNSADLNSSDLSSLKLIADDVVIPSADSEITASAENILMENESGSVMLDSDALSNFIAGLVNGSSFTGKISLIVNGEHASEKSAELINNIKEHRITAGQLLELLKDGNTISLENPDGQKEQGLLITLIEKNQNGLTPKGNYEALQAGITAETTTPEISAEASVSSEPSSSEKKIYVNADETVYEIRLSVIEAAGNIGSASPAAAGISSQPSNDYTTIIIKEASILPATPGSNMPEVSNTLFDSASGYELLADNSGRFTPGMFINSSFNRQMSAMNAPESADKIVPGESNIAEIISPAGEKKVQSENIVQSESNKAAVNLASVKSGNAGSDEIPKTAQPVIPLTENKAFEGSVIQADAAIQTKESAAAKKDASGIKQAAGSPEKIVSNALTAESPASAGIKTKDLNVEELSYAAKTNKAKSTASQVETRTVPDKAQQEIIPSASGEVESVKTPEALNPGSESITSLKEKAAEEANNQTAQKSKDAEVVSLPFSRKLDRIKIDSLEPIPSHKNDDAIQEEASKDISGNPVNSAGREKLSDDKTADVKFSEVKTAEAKVSGSETAAAKAVEQRADIGVNSAEEKLRAEASGKSTESVSSGTQKISEEGSSDSYRDSQTSSGQKEQESKGDSANNEMHRKAEGANTFQTEIHKSSDVTLKVKPQNEAHGGHNAFRTVKAAEIMKEAAAFIQQNESRTLVLKVDPEYLGKIKIALEVTDSLMHASIEVENEAAKKVVESNINQLYTTLNQNGVQVQSLNISLAGYEQKQNKPQPQKKKFSGMSDEPEIEEKNPADEKQLGYNTYEYLA